MVFRVVISMTATVVSAANERHEHQGDTIKANITSIIDTTTVIITIMTITTMVFYYPEIET